jgi:uncharacterized protein (TIGR02453 family)
MIQKTTFKFLSDLKKNNYKIWFDENRPAYENARNDFLSFSQNIISGIAEFDINIALADLEAKKCITRLNRDIRFSKDKSPYKTNFFLIINQGGKNSNFASYFLQLQPNNIFAGGGVYMPEPPDLLKLRQKIEQNLDNLKAIIENPNFINTFREGLETPDKLAKPPKGFNASSPAIEYLKMKGFFAKKDLSDAELQNEKAVENLLKDFAAAKPLVDFLNSVL